MRIGQGYDVHRLVPGRRCVLGGVELPVDYGPLGHSDGDVAVHALMDALLGAAGAGDIGRLFPDTDPAWAGADSMALLEKVVALVRSRGYAPVNADITIVAQRPRLGQHMEEMSRRLSLALGGPGRVNVKATTEEGLGLTGDGMAVAAHAVALIE